MPLAKALVQPESTSNPELQRAKNELLAAEANLECARITMREECSGGNMTEGQERRAYAPVYYADERLNRAKAEVARLEAKK